MCERCRVHSASRHKGTESLKRFLVYLRVVLFGKSLCLTVADHFVAGVLTTCHPRQKLRLHFALAGRWTMSDALHDVPSEIALEGGTDRSVGNSERRGIKRFHHLSGSKPGKHASLTRRSAVIAEAGGHFGEIHRE